MSFNFKMSYGAKHSNNNDKYWSIEFVPLGFLRRNKPMPTSANICTVQRRSESERVCVCGDPGHNFWRNGNKNTNNAFKNTYAYNRTELSWAENKTKMQQLRQFFLLFLQFINFIPWCKHIYVIEIIVKKHRSYFDILFAFIWLIEKQ